MFSYLIAFAISILLSVASSIFLKKKNASDTDKSASSIDQDTIPRAVVGKNRVIVFGTCVLSNPNTIIDGAYRAETKTSGGSTGGK